MEQEFPYTTILDIKYDHLERIDVPAVVKAVTAKWYNETLTKVNDSVVRLGILEGEYHFHKHDQEDEFFVVLEGQLLIDVEGKGTIVLERHQGYTVPKGVVHRTRSPKKTIVLMVEAATVTPTGDG